MNFIFDKPLISLLFYTDNPYFFTTFSKFLSLLFPYFSVDEHLKACISLSAMLLWYVQSQKDSKDQESIQSSITPVQRYQMGK